MKKLGHYFSVYAIIISLLAIGTSACGADENENEEERFTRPDGAQQIISDAKLAEIEALGVTIYGGTNPPDVSGTYIFDSGKVVAQSFDQGNLSNVCDSIATWTVEKNGTVSVASEYTGTCSGNANSTGAFISGENNCFTTYAKGSRLFQGCETTEVSVESACVSDKGLVDYHKAFYATTHGYENCAALVTAKTIAPVDGIRVNKETDGLSARASE